MPAKQLTIPSWLMDVRYNGRIIPNGTIYDIAKTGANCQVFAYHLLRLHGLVVPDYRSSELWADTEFSKLVIANYQPLDLLFFHKKEEAYGAHIAIFIGHNQVLHLSKKNGRPVIWEINTFFQHSAYQFLLGGKRFFEAK